MPDHPKILEIYDFHKSPERQRMWNAAQVNMIHFLMDKGSMTDPNDWVLSGCSQRFEEFMLQQERYLRGVDDIPEEEAKGKLNKITELLKKVMKEIQIALIGEF
mgnify:CR=1 FL=1